MIEAEADIEISRPPPEVFAWVTDLSHAPEWLEGCVELALEAPGVWASGASLRYTYRLGGQQGSMAGLVAVHEPDRALRLQFADEMFAVAVSMRLQPSPAGTHVEHIVSIELKSFAMRLMAPMIRVGNQKQVAANLERLKVRLQGACG